MGVSFLLGTMVESVDNGDLKKVESDISLLVYLYAGVAIVITALILAYFPRCPIFVVNCLQIFALTLSCLLSYFATVSPQLRQATQQLRSVCLLQTDSSR